MVGVRQSHTGLQFLYSVKLARNSARLPFLEEESISLTPRDAFYPALLQMFAHILGSSTPPVPERPNWDGEHTGCEESRQAKNGLSAR